MTYLSPKGTRLLAIFQARNLFAPLAVILMTMMIFLAACGGGGSTNQPQTGQSKVGGDLSTGLNSDVVTLDPLKSTALVDRQVMLNIYDTLVRVDAQNMIQPDLATSWTQPNPKELDFTLRTDVKFQDGTPFNADAVVFNINRILSTPSSPRYSELSSVQAVTAVDPSHVRFSLKKAFSPLLATLTDRSGMILSPTVIKNLGANLGNAPTGAGSGPFMFSEWVKSDHLTIKRNPHYWQKDAQGTALPYLNSVKYRPMTNESVEFSNLQTGSIQSADTVGATNVAAVKSNSSLIYKQIPGLSFYGMMLNTKVAPFNDVNVRRAIAWGINKEEIVSGVLKGLGTVAQGPIPPSSWAYNKDFAPYTYSVAKAKAALSQSGKTSVSFTLSIASGSPALTQQAQFIQSELQPAGITVNIKQEPFATLLSDTSSHNFAAALLGWSGRPDPDGNMYSYFHTGGGNNDMQYSNPQVDKLLENARSTTDQQKRATDYQQAEQQIMQDVPYVFIYHGISIQATTNKVKNFTILPTTIMNFSNVYLSQ